MNEDQLNDCPDWRYLLLECYELYSHLDSGGSHLIRSHQRLVREAISRTMKANPQITIDVIAEKPVTKHLKRALDEGKNQPHLSSVIRSFESIHDRLNWQYGYEKMPRGLENKYAYAEICGPNGPVVSAEVILGVVLFARVVFTLPMRMMVLPRVIFVSRGQFQKTTKVFILRDQ